MSKAEIVWQFRHKIKRVVKRRLSYIRNRLSKHDVASSTPIGSTGTKSGQVFKARQLVRVRSNEEIQTTLDNWNHLKGCAYMEEMWSYCGTNQRILRPVNKFVDERDHRLKRARGIVFLEGVHCEGTIDYGRCDRNCYYFWREEWLEMIE